MAFSLLSTPESTFGQALTSFPQPVAEGLCVGGEAYDDGEPDGRVGFQDFGELHMVMRFDVPPGSKVEEVCICWTRANDFAIQEFDLVFFDADGPGGSPGTPLGVSFHTTGEIPRFPEVAADSYDVSELNLVSDSGSLYIGTFWFPGLGDEFFVCGDSDGGGTQPIFVSDDGADTWQTLSSLELAEPGTMDPTDALMIRARVTPPATGPCVPGPSTLCLAEGRFRVQATWATPQGTSGQGEAVSLTTDTGYFWFFNEANVEMVVKVLDACPVNNNFWVFAGGLTNVEVDLVVTDTLSGEVQTYRNPQGTPFQPIQDTAAFATCP